MSDFTSARRHGNPRAFERMKLMSMIPLNTGTEGTTPPPPSVLQRKMDSFSNTISNYTRTIDTMISVERSTKESKYQQDVPEHVKHRITHMTPGFRSDKKDTPGPTSYDPNFNSVLPSVKKTVLPTRDLKEQKQRSLTSAGFVRNYNQNIRDFDISKAEIQEFERVYPENDLVKPLKPSLCFTSHGERNVFANNSPAKHLVSADPMPFKNPPVIDFSRDQKPREIFHIEPDANRNYEKAADQQRNLKRRIPNAPSFAQQIDRDSKPVKNKRVELLEMLTQQQNTTLQRLTSKLENRERKSRENGHTFGQQRPRTSLLFPNESVVDEKEHILPYDPIASYKKTLPRVHEVEIRPRKRELTGPDFWKPAIGGR